MSNKVKLSILLPWAVLLMVVYWGLGNTSHTMTVTYWYFGLCLFFSVAFLFVSGGWQTVRDPQRPKPQKKKKKKQPEALHPVKASQRFRRFREDAPLPVPAEEPLLPPPNPLRIPDRIRYVLSPLLILLATPFYLVFCLDWILLKFFL